MLPYFGLGFIIVVAIIVVYLYASAKSSKAEDDTSQPGHWVDYPDTHLFMGTAKVNEDNGSIISLGSRASAEACHEACVGHGKCIAWTWHDAVFGNKFDNQCHGATSHDAYKIHSAAPGRFSSIFSV